MRPAERCATLDSDEPTDDALADDTRHGDARDASGVTSATEDASDVVSSLRLLQARQALGGEGATAAGVLSSRRLQVV